MDRTFRFVFYTDADAEKFKSSIALINTDRIFDCIVWHYIPCRKNELIKIIEITISDWYRDKVLIKSMDEDLMKLMDAYKQVVKEPVYIEDPLHDVCYIKPKRRTNNDESNK